MACCGLCRPKVKPTIKTNKNITRKKLNRIDMWIENVEGSYEPIVLPSKPPDEPKVTTNKEEITEAQRNYQSSNTSVSTNQDQRNQYDNALSNQNMTSRKQNLQYISSDLSIIDEIQSAISENDSTNIP
jgi:hypothetical protein